MSKFLGSNIAIILGILLVGVGANPGAIDTSIAGIVVILGALAYQSAKKRKLGLVKNTTLRKIVEAITIIITFFIIFLKSNVWELMYYNPVSNILIPIWVWGAYFTIIFFKRKKELS